VSGTEAIGTRSAVGISANAGPCTRRDEGVRIHVQQSKGRVRALWRVLRYYGIRQAPEVGSSPPWA